MFVKRGKIHMLDWSDKTGSIPRKRQKLIKYGKHKWLHGSHQVTCFLFSAQRTIFSPGGVLTADVITEASLRFIWTQRFIWVEKLRAVLKTPREFSCRSLSNTTFRSRAETKWFWHNNERWTAWASFPRALRRCAALQTGGLSGALDTSMWITRS